MPKARYAQVLLIAILFLAFALRLAPWGQNRFLEDEALYAYWGLQIASGADPMLNEEPVDKPPLHPYLLSLLFLLTPGSSLPSLPSVEGAKAGLDSSSPALPTLPPAGEAPTRETAARLPSLLASMSSIALIYSLGCLLYNRATGLTAALLLALSPFDILFASTAFTDPLMTALVLAALVAAAKNKWGLAGLLLGLAVATKQQAIFFLPLVVVTGWLAVPPGSARAAVRTPSRTRVPAWLHTAWHLPWLRFGLGLIVVLAGIIWWDSARFQRPGFLQQSLISYGGLGPAQSSILAQRGVEWLALLRNFWVSDWLNLVMLAILGLWLVAGCLRSGIEGPTNIDWVLTAFALAYLLLHWLVGFQVWDRYLLGLVPLFALLVGRALVSLVGSIQRPNRRRAFALAMSMVLILGLPGPLLRAVRSDLPVGGDHGAYDGIQDLATYMRTQAPPGSVLYHYWLGYHYRFYLYGAPLRLHWYPNLEDLTHDATVYRREPRYLAFPSWRDGAPVVASLSEAGIDLIPVLETERRSGDVSFRLYRLEGP